VFRHHPSSSILVVAISASHLVFSSTSIVYSQPSSSSPCLLPIVTLSPSMPASFALVAPPSARQFGSITSPAVQYANILVIPFTSRSSSRRLSRQRPSTSSLRCSPHLLARISLVILSPTFINRLAFCLRCRHRFCYQHRCLVNFLIVLLQHPHCPSISRVLNCAEHVAVYLLVNLAIGFAIHLIITSLLSPRYSPGEIR
jgi:hypothetical protein